MLPRWVSLLFLMLAEHFAARRSAQIQFLKLQIELLRAKLPGNRVILSPEDRGRLLRAGADMELVVHDVLGIVNVKTYKHWVREAATGKEPGRVGSPKMTESLRKLIVKLAKDNVGWGIWITSPASM